MSEFATTTAPYSGSYAPVAAGYAAPEGYREGWLDELKLDLFAVPRPSGGLMYPHKGQAVWLAPYGMSLEEEFSIQEYIQAAPDAEDLDRKFEAALRMLSRLVVDWNITDGQGRPYPRPSGEGNTEPFKALPSRLVTHIMQQVRGTGETEGNASAA